MKTIVLGLGNPILGDDGVGWKVADEVRRQLASRPNPTTPPSGQEPGYVDVEFVSLGGLSLMERLIGYDQAILIDAVNVQGEVGAVTVSKLSQMPDYSAFHVASAHDTSLQNALRMGRQLGTKLPEDVTVVGIAIRAVYCFSEELSPPVARAVPAAAHAVMSLL